MPSHDASRQRQEIRDRIRSLQARANRGLWAVAAFLAVSIVASRGFDLLPPLSATVREWLGIAPPVRLIQLALVIYAFSASVLTLGRMAKGEAPARGWPHLFYLASFFAFFHFAAALPDNFWAVLVAGATVLGLAAYHGWTYCSLQVRQQETLLEELERRQDSGRRL